ncbi:hypothetical protein DERP_000313 [Dermatophagoides pteronyssinus]|uniref:Uncharacterized protein n=1 Tax=Dermatophagoides pteronyssinus TaxID=6956 RepID=A0ABQ8IZT4_DERPT|nr:hypothetical protein DERP_000313 [Dermatophagoides pteronyssinus]
MFYILDSSWIGNPSLLDCVLIIPSLKQMNGRYSLISDQATCIITTIPHHLISNSFFFIPQ